MLEKKGVFMSGFTYQAITALAFTVFAQGCNDSGFQVAPLDTQGQTIAPVPPPTVCDPFGSGGTSTRQNGFDAKLTYILPNSPVIAAGLTTASFETGSTDVVTSPIRLILSQLAISTRPFTEGFAAKDTGAKLTDLNGDILNEYFSVRGAANLKLGPTDMAGDYEIALLSDDGSILDVDQNANGNYTRWVDNDGTHGNTFACAPNVLTMTATSEIPMRMNYYQGPRVRIALMMLWRLKNATAEMECGHLRADDYYFVPVGTNPSSPTANYNALLTRGWKPLSPANYVLPNQTVNPCAAIK